MLWGKKVVAKEAWNGARLSAGLRRRKAPAGTITTTVGVVGGTTMVGVAGGTTMVGVVDGTTNHVHSQLEMSLLRKFERVRVFSVIGGSFSAV